MSDPVGRAKQRGPLRFIVLASIMSMQPILIVGGGIGGLAAAVALKRAGLAAEVFERSPEIREVGAGLSLWSNAVTALRILGLQDAVLSVASEFETVVTRTERGAILGRTNIGALARRFGAPSVCVHRGDLRRILHDAIDPRTVHLDSACVGFDADESGVTLHLAGGTTVRGSLLVGADGIRSVIRDRLLGPSPPRYAGYFAYRGIAHGRFPTLPDGHSEFAVGRGAQIGGLRCGADRVYWFATVNAPPDTPIPPPDALKADAVHRFSGWQSPVTEMIAATEPAAILKNDIIDRKPTWPWGRGRVTLLGDAIHPTTPNLGQGACMALEDAVVLANCLRPGVNEEALREYESIRRDRTAMVTRRSHTLGRLFQLESRPLIALRNWFFRRPGAERQGVKLLEQLLSWSA
jgi:2-polyprenyl-6-methoxyphenol hydroxylase-like FAD-dependent oxidoreductase